MAINFDTKKSAEKLSGFLQKTSEMGKTAASNVQKSAVALSEKVKEDSYQWRLKKYNPLFSTEYLDTAFHIPSLIVIVDDAVRRGIDVCEGAIGWRNIEGDAEVLFLYSDATELRKIQFYPSALTDAAYYIDPFDPHRYIRVDCIFSKAHEERLAELKNVAYSLGAKCCTIEITEAKQEVSSGSRSVGLGGKAKLFGSVSAKAEDSTSNASSTMRSGKIFAEFEGSATPHRPKLKWFAHDENIKKLIEMRCKGTNTLKSETLELSGSSSATMTHKTAATIDGAICKMGIKGNFSMQSQAMVEHSSKLIFSVEF